MPALVELFGSNATFNAQLDEFFLRARDILQSNLLPNPYYWSGNEPDIQAVYLFHYSGRSDLTQMHVRWLMENKYTIYPAGISGNDDFGTMSAWFVWSALGIYPISCGGIYALGSPLFDSVILTREAGDVTIIAYNNSLSNVYVDKVLLNGVQLDSMFVPQAEILGGAKLEFFMSAQPSLDDTRNMELA